MRIRSNLKKEKSFKESNKYDHKVNLLKLWDFIKNWIRKKVISTTFRQGKATISPVVEKFVVAFYIKLKS